MNSNKSTKALLWNMEYDLILCDTVQSSWWGVPEVAAATSSESNSQLSPTLGNRTGFSTGG